MTGIPAVKKHPSKLDLRRTMNSAYTAFFCSYHGFNRDEDEHFIIIAEARIVLKFFE